MVFGVREGGVISRRIVILTGSHLCHNPRAMKEALSLARNGFEVRVLGAWTNETLKARDKSLIHSQPYRFTPVVDTTAKSLRGRLAAFGGRAHRKATNFVCRLSGRESLWQLGNIPSALLAVAERSPADLYIGHLEAGMAAARSLMTQGRCVGIDMEDWYSEDLLPEARTHRPVGILRGLERDLLRGGVHATCPSAAMSMALAEEYRCPRPTIVYNAFPVVERQQIDGETKDRQGSRKLSIHWFSQTIGPGRGLDDLLAAIALLNLDFEVHLRGERVSGFDAWLMSKLSPKHRDRVFVHGLVPNHELLSRIGEHDIGFAGEMRYCRSRELTITNKILQYLLAGLAVVASDTLGQSEVASQTDGAVRLYSSGRPETLAAQLRALLESPQLLAKSKAAALQAAMQTFCWERQEPRFLASIESALASKASPARTAVA